MSFRWSVKYFIFYSVKHIRFRAKESVFAVKCTALLYFKKSAADAHRILVETYGDHALSETRNRDWFRRFKKNDFEVEDKECSSTLKKFEDETLEAFLPEDSCQVQFEFAESLGVNHTAVLKRLKAFGMIKKQGLWVHYVLKSRDIERRLVTWEQLHRRQKRKVFGIVSARKSVYTTITLSVEDHGVSSTMHQPRRSNWISMVRRICSVFSGISWI